MIFMLLLSLMGIGYLNHAPLNPSQNDINIESRSNPIVSLKMYTISGSLLQEIDDVNDNTTTLNISTYSNGVYFVNVTLDNGVSIVQKIIKN